jgi:uncharacterized protein
MKTIMALLVASMYVASATGQVAPSAAETTAYTGLQAAAARGDAVEILRLVAGGAGVDVRDSYGRTPLHIAAFGGKHDAMRALVKSGANPNALEHDRYDIVTIASVANDLPTLKVALDLGCSAANVTSRYDGTALIAASHLGHVDIVRELIRARAWLQADGRHTRSSRRPLTTAALPAPALQADAAKAPIIPAALSSAAR